MGETLIREKREFIDDEELENLYKEYRERELDKSKSKDDYSFNDNSTFKMSFDDTHYRKQWYLVCIIE